MSRTTALTGLWLALWVALLALLFSGIGFTAGPFAVHTLSLDWDFVRRWFAFISGGVVVTIELSLVAIAAATALGFAAALARISRIPPLASFAELYVSLIRGTPLFLQFLFAYQALPQLGVVFTSFAAAAIALALNYGAYLSEVFRAGIQAVGRGQSDAAFALGLSRAQTLRAIVLPQAFRIVLPDVANQFIAMQKDTALASAIAVEELMGRARQAGLPRQHFFEALMVAAGWYWALTVVLGLAQNRLERRLSRGEGGHA